MHTLFHKKTKKHPEFWELIFYLAQSWFSAFAICNIGGISAANILSALIFGLMLLLFSCSRHLLENSNPPRGFFFTGGLLSVLYTAFYMAAEHTRLTGGFDSRLFRFGYVLATTVGLYFLFFCCVRILLLLFSAHQPALYEAPLSFFHKALVFCALLLGWLFWFLYNYPGVMTPDSISQFSQVTGLIPYSSHHSLIHTLLFGLFYRIGLGITGDVNAGIACYIVFQMLLLAGVETCCVSQLSKSGVPKWMLALWVAFWALMPYNGIYAVTMWKDILFSAFVLLYAIVLFRLLSDADWRIKTHWGTLILLFFSGWLTCMLRANGLYVFLFMVPFVLIAFRRHIKAMLPIQLAILFLAFLVKGPVFHHFQVADPHFTESLSIPLQQVARVVTEGRSLTSGQEALINQVVDISLIPDYYDPVISDPVKALVLYNNADYLIGHKKEFLCLWAQLGMAYPRDYMEAFIDQTKGYWYPAPAELRTFEGMSPNEAGLSWPHLLRGQLPVKISEILLKMPDVFPVYGLLWSIGAFTWLMLFLAAFQFLYGERKYLLLFLPFIGTILTLLLATPVASDLRYAYPMILGMPFLISVVITGRKKEERYSFSR